MPAQFALRLLLACTILCGALNSYGNPNDGAGESPRELRACVSDEAFPPWTYPDRDGLVQYLLRHAAQAQGLSVRFIAEPRSRCIYNLKAGNYEWLSLAADFSELHPFLLFPMRNGVADPEYQLGSTSMVVVTSQTSALSWDGQQLSNLQGPVLYYRGTTATEQWLKTQPYDALPVNSPLIAARMILAGRCNAAVMPQAYVDGLHLQNPEVAAQLRVLKPVVLSWPMFSPASRAYALAHPEQVQAIWDEMLRLQESPGYLELEQQLAREIVAGVL
jgi:polar amino acid transport system substrate-binding protein